MTEYNELTEAITAVSEGVNYDISVLSNASALIYDAMEDLNWCGFYIMKDGKLILGPFQGKIACTEIELGHGVCGTAALNDETVLVPDVHSFDGHIPCDSRSNSEIVVPIHKRGNLYGVLDIDSPSYNRFSTEDKVGLELVVNALEVELDKI